MIRIAVLVLPLLLLGCDPLRSAATRIGSDIVDCTTAQVRRATAELGPAIRPLVVAAAAGESPNWESLTQLAKGWSLELGGCVLASVATDLAQSISNATATHAQQLDPGALRSGVKAVLVERFGNAFTWRTPAGSL